MLIFWNLGLTPSTSMSSTVLVVWFSSLRLTCPYQRSRFCIRCVAIGWTVATSLISSFLLCSLRLTPCIHRNILISVLFISISSFFFIVQHSAPYIELDGYFLVTYDSKKVCKGMFLYSAVSSPLDRSKRFTLSSPGRPVHSDTNSASPGSILARQQLRAKTKSLTFPPLSIARYSFIQLNQLGCQWRERKCPIFETVANRIRTRAHLIASPAFYNWATALHLQTRR